MHFPDTSLCVAPGIVAFSVSGHRPSSRRANIDVLHTFTASSTTPSSRRRSSTVKFAAELVNLDPRRNQEGPQQLRAPGVGAISSATCQLSASLLARRLASRNLSCASGRPGTSFEATGQGDDLTRDARAVEIFAIGNSSPVCAWGAQSDLQRTYTDISAEPAPQRCRCRYTTRGSWPGPCRALPARVHALDRARRRCRTGCGGDRRRGWPERRCRRTT